MGKRRPRSGFFAPHAALQTGLSFIKCVPCLRGANIPTGSGKEGQTLATSQSLSRSSRSWGSGARLSPPSTPQPPSPLTETKSHLQCFSWRPLPFQQPPESDPQNTVYNLRSVRASLPLRSTGASWSPVGVAGRLQSGPRTGSLAPATVESIPTALLETTWLPWEPRGEGAGPGRFPLAQEQCGFGPHGEGPRPAAQLLAESSGGRGSSLLPVRDQCIPRNLSHASK
uniref:Uncharacterized protein LOC110205761 n=1 Tax=Phascolarctos cinereus TaxID=38626 RepID=A0A6P5JZH4_PHACI|nr:uncharacterized protein LOC110205761 [Phascolarctos cinereus]